MGKGDVQRERILEFIAGYIAEHGNPPTRREITDGLGISSTSVVNYRIRQLEDRGWVKVTPNVGRGLVLLEPAA